jgi:FKBP-type peptidyl-prolyl cis-trans isomerase FkpA
MKISAPFALAAALLVASCGAPEESSAPPAEAPVDKPAETPAAPAPDASTSAPSSQTATVDKPAAPKAPAPPKAPPAKPAYTRTDLKAGTGAEAQKGKSVSVHYTGWLYDPAQPGMKGRMFDSSQERGPFTFLLGAGQVIPGWDQGFDGMKVGGRRRLIIPPSLGYGVDGAGGGIIPPNATLLFEMELLEVK